MLDITEREFRAAMETATRILADWRWRTPSQRPLRDGASASDLKRLIDKPLPADGTSIEDVLSEIEAVVYGHSLRTCDPRFMGYFTSGGHPAGIVGNFLADGLNQNAAKWHVSPLATELEQIVLRWIAEFIGFPLGCGGVLTTGGTMANVVGLTVARDDRLNNVAEDGMYGQPRLAAYVSEQGHASIGRALSQLGIGSNALRRISVRSDNLAMDARALENQIARDVEAGLTPFCVVGSAGTTNTGAIDPLEEIADLCAAKGLWLHIDGAYGAPAASTSVVGDRFKGMDRADSISVDPHKWLFVPFESGCVLVKDKDKLFSTYAYSAEYLESDKGLDDDRLDFMNYGPELTRGVRALKVWTLFKTYGADGVRAAISNNIDVMRGMGRLIEAADDFELMAPVGLSVVCFRYNPGGRFEGDAKLNAFNERLAREIEQDGRIFLSSTRIRTAVVLRAASVNYALHTDHIQAVLEVTREIAKRMSEA